MDFGAGLVRPILDEHLAQPYSSDVDAREWAQDSQDFKSSRSPPHDGAGRCLRREHDSL
jgi:hypothetical protein